MSSSENLDMTTSNRLSKYIAKQTQMENMYV